MSSLMQHRGAIDRQRGVELLVYLTKPKLFHGAEYPAAPWLDAGERCAITWSMDDAEPTTLTRSALRGGGPMVCPKLYRIWRKPRGMFGCWVVFRINGKDSVPDLSVPIGLDKLPRDAKPLTDAESVRYWESE